MSVALRFVEQRRFHMDGSVVVDDFSRTSPHGPAITLAQLDAMEVFERASLTTDVDPSAVSPTEFGTNAARDTLTSDQISVRFAHETIFEYFAAARLSRDFLRILDITATHRSLSGLSLAHVSLDFFQSSIYGFFAETLESVDYRARLIAYLGNADLTMIPELLLRNLLEYIGLTTVGPAHGVARLLLTVIEDDRLTTLIRYNAARALERIHPLAPRPYFEYVSDWGSNDFNDFAARRVTDSNDGPWVMRGWKSATPTCRRYLAFAPNHPTWPLDQALQREIGGRLITILAALCEDSRRELLPLRVNCSLALIRWFHNDHHVDLDAVCNVATSNGVEDETLDNLTWGIRQYARRRS